MTKLRHRCYECRKTYWVDKRIDKEPQFTCKHWMPLCRICYTDWFSPCPICDAEISGDAFMDTFTDLILLLMILITGGLIFLIASRRDFAKRSLLRPIFQYIDCFLPQSHKSYTDEYLENNNESRFNIFINKTNL